MIDLKFITLMTYDWLKIYNLNDVRLINNGFSLKYISSFNNGQIYVYHGPRVNIKRVTVNGAFEFDPKFFQLGWYMIELPIINISPNEWDDL